MMVMWEPKAAAQQATHGVMPEPGSRAAGRTLGITGARPQARLGAVGRSPSIDEWPYY